MKNEKITEYQKEFKVVRTILEEWGGGQNPRFIWFRELDRLTGIDRGLLRNIINDLKKNREVKEIRGQNKRIFFALTKHYKKCYESEQNFKGKNRIVSNEAEKHSKVKGLSRTQKSIQRTQKRIEKQQRRREVKIFSRAKHQRKINS